MSSTEQSGAGSDDGILDVARDVCLKMPGYAKFSPLSVSWETQPRSRYTPPFLVRSDMPYIRNGRLVLPLTMKDRLTPEDWRPLIASSLVHYYSKARRRADKIVWGRYVLPFIAVFSYFFIGFWSYGPTPAFTTSFRLFLIGGDVVMVSMAGVILYSRMRFWHVMWFMSDRVSCRLLGDKKSMLEVLSKISGLQPADVMSVEKSRLPNSRPRISERITHLSKPIHY